MTTKALRFNYLFATDNDFISIKADNLKEASSMMLAKGYKSSDFSFVQIITDRECYLYS
jgi:hypothetical protein